MWQEIIITDVTRMSGDRVCIAGVDKKGNCIRPLLAYPDMICEDHLYINDMVIIRPRAVVNMFLEPDPKPVPPHTEDHLWINPNQIEYLRQPDDAIWKIVLKRIASKSVAEIFEADLHKNKKVTPGEGVRSLGTIQAASIETFGYYELEFDEAEGKKGKYTLSFIDAAGEKFYQIPVTDLSLRYYLEYLHTQGRMRPRQIRELMEQKLAKAEIWLRLGLTRPYQKSDGDQKWCYIQVTGLYTFPDYLEGHCFADFRPDKKASLL